MKPAMVEDEHYYKKQAMRLSAKVKELEGKNPLPRDSHSKEIETKLEEENEKLKDQLDKLKIAYDVCFAERAALEKK